MELMPTTCPKCGDRMSMPIPGRRTGLLISTCRNGECLYTERSATPLVAASFASPAPTADHGRMFRPSTSAPEPPRPKASAMDQFDRAATAGTLREAIKKQRQLQRETEPIDPKLKQLGGDR